MIDHEIKKSLKWILKLWGIVMGFSLVLALLLPIVGAITWMEFLTRTPFALSMITLFLLGFVAFCGLILGLVIVGFFIVGRIQHGSIKAFTEYEDKQNRIAELKRQWKEENQERLDKELEAYIQGNLNKQES